ncbi:GNAT family N-acetyltransferase [Derxia gummosa]|uniref:GNAT family N-acetyltransferase n=1 Tax=Derxia gummosa DSM 723 TaxID=1121388 RepID=A0A8B6X7U2_9BURK|nr:GNAT family N-acetyltransferase [Derxia gummosa]
MNAASPTDVQVVHNPGASRFEATVEGQLCVADYYLDGQRMVMNHTGVPRALEGRGIAARLVAAAFAHAAREGLTIVPQCSYVAVWARRHPEQAAGVVAGG